MISSRDNDTTNLCERASYEAFSFHPYRLRHRYHCRARGRAPPHTGKNRVEGPHRAAEQLSTHVVIWTTPAAMSFVGCVDL